MRTEGKRKSGLGLVIGVAALCLAAPLASVAAPTAFGRLSIYGSVEASYSVEARTGQFTAIGQGVAESGSLRAPVMPGQTVVRVKKANSRSAAYTLVISGGREPLEIRDLSYDAPITIDVPDATPGSSLTLTVLPN